MKGFAIILAPVGAVIGGAIGAGIWAGVALATGYEVGYIAWGVGILVGVGAAVLGGRGILCGVLCALVALAAIYAGKVMAASYQVSDVVHMAELMLTEDMYREHQKDAKDLLALGDDIRYPEYLVAHNYGEATRPSEVTQEEIRRFQQHDEPFLREMAARRMSYPEWKAAYKREFLSSGAVSANILENLDFIDYLFGFFGIVTAFRVGMGLGLGEE